MRLDTDKTVCRELAQLMSQHGVRRVFLSPGSRNAPLIVAIVRSGLFEVTTVVDERCAAFMALGYASIAGQPVAIVCTSGTALLNYAPAVAEAYYRRLPLIVVSADRPAEWIDQDDSQTLRQPGALANFVKVTCDIPESTTPNLLWYANRVINDALISATTGRQAPVHINVQLDAPLGHIVAVDNMPLRKIDVIEPHEGLDTQTIDTLHRRLHESSVLVIAGFNTPDVRLNSALDAMAQWGNVVVLTETISNLHSPHFIPCIDNVMCRVNDRDFTPDIVITVGGALVSRFVKEYLRNTRVDSHWHVGISHTTVDCFRQLSLRIEMDPGAFFEAIVSHSDHADASSSQISHMWHKAYDEALSRRTAYLDGIPWSDMQAFDTLMRLIPTDCNVQYSNGTPIRYAQLFGDRQFHRSDCNRGVSGIDGCTSTAVGASMADAARTTILITGDTSAQYDVGAFANIASLSSFKMIVMCNGGGGIFRFISSTSELAELDDYFSLRPHLPLHALAAGYGLGYYEVHERQQLLDVWHDFLSDDTPAVLAIHTPAQQSATILKNYFKYLRQ